MPLRKLLKTLFIGKSRDLHDSGIFHKVSLIAFFAWVGLGADGLSSSCYGPPEAFLALGTHTYLSIFVALGTVFTIFIIAASYSHIVELFPTGGGGYLVASKLLSPTVGMVSGCALLIDYVLTIAVSIASGSDALFSILPLEWHNYRLAFALIIILVLTILNMRGVKESVLALVPIFLVFVITHVFIIIYGFFTHASNLPNIASSTVSDVGSTVSSIGFFGMLFLVMRAYSMGAGTYTGLEAVSNGLPVLREPKVQTAKSTMRYMAFSLSFMVFGLMLMYLLYNVTAQPGKTLNAILFEQATSAWSGRSGYIFVLVALVSEATLLFVAAQTGFLDGPRVLANMAKDRWFPVRFSSLSDRLVTQNGILIMSGLALLMMVISRGSVRFLVVLYSINVFITFVLSQLGMVRHWWEERGKAKHWLKKLFVNGIGLILTGSILVSMLVFKFFEGGWITILITGALVIVAILIRRHYLQTMKMLHRLNHLVSAAEISQDQSVHHKIEEILETGTFEPKAKTAVLLVNGFNGMGLHTLFGVIRLFGSSFKNFVFLEVGVVDSGNFKGAQELDKLHAQVHTDLSRYVRFMKKQGFYAQGISVSGVDAIEEIVNIAPDVVKRFPNSVFFGGQLIFPKDTFITRVLHNYTVFTLQRKLYREGIPFVILPIRV
jgi:amino acid transporter